jgi:hypothetical protein
MSPERRLTRIQIGVVGVDSARLVITDPSYIKSQWTPELVDRCWDLTPSPLLAGQLKYQAGHDGLGVVFLAGLGDGVYPVFAVYEDVGPFGRRIARVTVELLPRASGRVKLKRPSGTGGSSC